MTFSCGICVLLLIPVTLFIVSLFIRPAVGLDPSWGFLAFRSMLEGGSFNSVTAPDPANIAKDVEVFLSWWSPGQYLIPGIFVWFGTDYGLAISVTTLLATVIGVIGWAQVARNFDVPCSILFLFIFGLVTFRYITIPFLLYNGGEVLLFAVSPWSLYALQKVVDKPAAACLAISLLSAALLFLAKLTGLVAFTANIVAISLVDVVKRRRVTSSLLAIWAGSAIAALFFLIFWLAWGRVPATPVVPWWSASWPGFAFTWLAIWFPMVGATFSGISGLDFLSGLFLRPSGLIKIYVLGPLGLLLMGWVWFRLRSTRYRSMAVCLFSIIAIYAAAFVVMYVRGAAISFEERHLRYAGILFLLLMLVAINQWRESLAKAVTILIVGSFAVYGLTSYVNIAREFMRGRHYDPVSGVSMRIVSPVVLEYLRSEMAVQKWQDAIAVVPSPEAAIGLPRFRIIEVHVDFSSLEEIAAGKKWAGRVEKVFVMVRETMRGNGKAEALLRLFVDYDIEKWRQIQLDGMIVYSQ